MHRGILPIALSFLLLCACSTTGPVKFAVPTSRLSSPEASGRQWGGNAHAGLYSERKVTITRDYGLEAVNGTPPRIESIGVAGFGVGLGLHERIDAGVTHVPSAPWLFELKYQCLGTSRREAEPGNFSLALSIGGGASSREDSGSDQALFNPRTARYEIDSSIVELGLILGYRLSPSILSYGGATAQRVAYHGEQTTFDQRRTEFRMVGHQLIYHVGLQVHPPRRVKEPIPGQATPQYEEPSFFGQLEGSVAKMELSPSEKTHVNGAINVGFFW